MTGSSAEPDTVKPIVCQVINSREVSVVIPTSMLLEWLGDPNRSVPQALSDLQPEMLARKEENIGAYQAYIERMITGAAFGITPQIVLFSAERLVTQAVDVGGLSIERVLIPSTLGFATIDGQSQAAARAGATVREPIAQDSRVSVRILHGATVEDARQAVYDLNTYGVRLAASAVIARDNSNPANRIANQLTEASEVLRGHVIDARSASSRDKEHVVTLSAVRTGIAATFFGKSGFAKVNDIDALRGIDAEKHADHVIYLWSTLLDHLKAEFAHPRRVNSVVPSPAVMGALGAMLHRCMPEPICPAGEFLGIEEVIERLDGVSWDRSYTDPVGKVHSVWVGPGGKAQRDHSVSLGGPKEVGHRVFDALFDRGSEDGKQIRTQPTYDDHEAPLQTWSGQLVLE